MTFPDILFYVFAGILCLGALGVVSARNPMYCVLFLILCFFNATGLFLLLGAEFLGLLLLMVYVGAVAVMFLFVLMTVDIDFAVLKEGFASYLPLGLGVGIVLLAELLFSIKGGLFSGLSSTMAQHMDTSESQNIVALGEVLFTNYIFAFQAAGFILLVAMVGAIVLTHRQRDGVKRQNLHEQLTRPQADCLKVVKVKSGQGVDV